MLQKVSNNIDRGIDERFFTLEYRFITPASRLLTTQAIPAVCFAVFDFYTLFCLEFQIRRPTQNGMNWICRAERWR